MAYEELGNITIVQLGGINKTTNKKNPTELEGYYLGAEPRPNKFNPAKPQNLYRFQTAQGEVGVFGKAGIDKVMKGAKIGTMTKLVNTGELLDTGKGLPMKVYKAFQDKHNFIDVDTAPVTTNWSDNEDSYSDDEDTSTDEVTPSRPVAPAVAASTPSAERQARVQALLNKSRS